MLGALRGRRNFQVARRLAPLESTWKVIFRPVATSIMVKDCDDAISEAHTGYR